MAVAVSMRVPQGASRAVEDLADEDDLDLRWLEDRLTWAARLGDAAQALRGWEADSEISDELERWRSLEETAKLRCEKRREASKLEKLEKRLHLVSTSCVEAQSQLAGLKRERDLLKDCVQELLVLTQPGSKALSRSEVVASPGRQRSPEVSMVAKGATTASLAPPVARTPQGATPRSARSGGAATPNVLTVPGRRVRFDDKLMESPREPRVPLPAGQVWHYVPILKHHPAEPITQQEPTAVAAGGETPGSARRSRSPTPSAQSDNGLEALPTMDSARLAQASGEPVVRQDASCGQVQLPRWAAASPPAAPQLIHVASAPRLVQGPGQPVPAVQPWILRQPMAQPMVSRPGAAPVTVRRVIQRT
eukprot:s571_g33.t1